MKKEKRFQKCVPWKYGKDLDIAIFITSGRLANNEIRGRKGQKVRIACHDQGTRGRSGYKTYLNMDVYNILILYTSQQYLNVP